MHNSSPSSPTRPVPATHSAYPPRCLELRPPPACLYARGSLWHAAPPAVAIVGTRTATPYGVRIARALASACARAGVSVVSGLARGVDAAAHEAALAAGGRTVAVLGTGPDLYYPRSHRALQERIAQEGCLLSEHPDGSTGHAGSFPRRNRIIAALADVTVVVEAGVGSGALITADHALELGRTVACVPNAIDVPTAAGSNALLKAHAEPILHPNDLLALLSMAPVPTTGPVLQGEAADCWHAIHQGALDVETVARTTRLSVREVAAQVALLEVEGLLTVDLLGRIQPTVGLGTA